MDDERYLAERLSLLSHDALATLAAQLARTSDLAQQIAADAIFTAKKAVAEVLLSPDLLPFIAAQFDIGERAPMEVSHLWRSAWMETDGSRRGLRPAKALPLTDDIKQLQVPINDLAGTSNGWLAISHGDNDAVSIVDCDMRQVYLAEDIGVYVTASSEYLYTTDGTGTVQRRCLADPSQVTSRNVNEEDENTLLTSDTQIHEILHTDGALFAAGCMDDHYCVMELDPQTLALRNTFGDDYTDGVIHSLAVLADELYAADSLNVLVFSLAGEYRRTLCGEIRGPYVVRACAGRIYVLERRAVGSISQRIVVVTPHGETVQIYDCTPHIPLGRAGFNGIDAMTICGGKLVLGVTSFALDENGEFTRPRQQAPLERSLVPLRGL